MTKSDFAARCTLSTIPRLVPFLLCALPVFGNIQLNDPVFKTKATVDYLIVTSSDPAFVTQAQRLADLKWEQGLQARIETTDSIGSKWPGIDIQNKIRTCIQSYYADSGITWLLLLGDYLVVPARKVTNADSFSGEYSDTYYACLDGKWDPDADGYYGVAPSDTQYAIHYVVDSAGYLVPDGLVPVDVGLDIWPDVYVGRLPASNAAEAGIMVDKIVRYSTDYRQAAKAKDLALFGPQMFNLVKSPDSLFISDVADYLHYGIKPVFKAAGSVFADGYVHERYEDSITAGDAVVGDSVAITRDTIAALLSLGSNLVQFCAHGSPQSIWICAPAITPKRVFTTADVMTLSSPTLSNVIGLSCNLINMPPESTVCFGKAFLVNPSGGAVSFYGCVDIDNSEPAWPLTQEAMQSLCSGVVTRLAPALQYFNASYANSDRPNMYRHSFWGDPEMEIWTRVLSAADTIAVSVGKNESGIYVFTLPKIDSILVSIREPGGRFMRRYTSAGVARFDTITPAGDTLVVTAAKHDFPPARIVVKASELPPAATQRLAMQAKTFPTALVSVKKGNEIHISRESGAAVVIYDVAGHSCYRGPCEGQVLENRFATGLYIARVVRGDGKVAPEIERFCIQR